MLSSLQLLWCGFYITLRNNSNLDSLQENVPVQAQLKENREDINKTGNVRIT